MHKAGVGEFPKGGLLPQVLVEHGRRDERFSPTHGDQVLGPEPAPRPEVQDRLAGQNMERVANRHRPPSELDRRGCGVAKPIGFASTLHFAKIALETHEFRGKTRPEFDEYTLAAARPADPESAPRVVMGPLPSPWAEGRKKEPANPASVSRLPRYRRPPRALAAARARRRGQINQLRRRVFVFRTDCLRTEGSSTIRRPSKRQQAAGRQAPLFGTAGVL